MQFYECIKKGKGFPYSIPSIGPGADPGVQAVSLQVTVSHSPGGRLPLPSARPAVTSPAAEHHCPLAGTKLYCLVTEAHRCKQLAYGCYAALPRAGFEPATYWSQAQMPYHCTTAPPSNMTTIALCESKLRLSSLCVLQPKWFGTDKVNARSTWALTQTLTSAPDAPGIISAILRRLMPRVRFILREWIFRISSRAYGHRHISYDISQSSSTAGTLGLNSNTRSQLSWQVDLQQNR